MVHSLAQQNKQQKKVKKVFAVPLRQSFFFFGEGQYWGLNSGPQIW
jgi:hypothetical protein